MQYHLSTIFLVIFVTAASLAHFEVCGIWVVLVLLLAALCLNRAKRLSNGIWLAISLIFVGIICPGVNSAVDAAHLAARRHQCQNNLKQIGVALRRYGEEFKHFPPVYSVGTDGKPLQSWLASVLPAYLDNLNVCTPVKVDEPWDSPFNARVFKQYSARVIQCPSAKHESKDCFTNYIAIVGPGTIWRKEGPVELSAMPDNRSHTVALVEAVQTGRHWAEPFALTVDEVLDNTKSGKGVRISSCHKDGVNVLFADATVRRFPSKMPLSLWRRILDGELSAAELDTIDSLIDRNASDMVNTYAGEPQRDYWLNVSGAAVWLASVALLFRRAVKNRQTSGKAKISPNAGEAQPQ